MRLGDLVGDVDQSGPPANSDSFLYIDISSVDAGSKSITAARRLPTHEAPSRARQRVRAGDVLVSTVRPNLNAVALVPESMDGAIASTGFCVLRPRTESLDASYLFHFVRSPKMVRYLTRLATGASYPAVTDRIIMDAALSVPPISDQRHLACALDTSDRVITKRREAIALTDDLLQATFLEMFGACVGVVERRGWRSLQSLCTSSQYGTAEKANESGNGVPVLRMNNVLPSGELDLEDLKWVDIDHRNLGLELNDGDILFNRTNSRELVGKTAVWHADDATEYTFAGYLIRLRVDRSLVDPDYVWGALNSTRGKETLLSIAKPSINMANISASDLARIYLDVPSLERQREFAKRHAEIRRYREKLRKALAESERLFASLQHRAFQGEL